MPVEAASPADLEDLEHNTASAIQRLEQRLAALEADVIDLEMRVTSLEVTVSAPPEPGTPEHPIVIPPEPIPPDPPAAGVVTVHMAGNDYAYDPAAGTDVGSYRDPDGRFTMSCIRVKRDDCRLVLDFRATDAWQCVVFEHSDPTNGDQPILAYEATISDGAPIAIAGHYGNAAWRWQSCPWPHPLTPLETLYERKLLPRHDPDLACGKAGSLSTVTSAPPMSLCGFTPGMGGTGGRADIGVVTGWQAEWMCTQGADMLTTVLVQGEAAFPWRFRDVESGSMLDVIKAYPKASQHWGSGPSGQPQIYQSPGTGIGLDAAHSPSCYYVPFLLTGDPYFLEMQQGECAYHFIEIPRNPQTVVGSEQVRGIAWSLRTLLNTADATPDEVPGWLLPKSIFVDELERQRGLLQARQGDGWVYRGFAHLIDSYGRWQHAWWQHDYATAIAAWASMLHPEWAQQRDWMVQGIAGRNDPNSGWCVGYPTSYWTNTTAKNDYAPELSFTDWAAAWDYNSKYVYTDLVNAQCPTLEDMLSRNTTYDYFSAMMHALRLASQAGCARADEVLATLVEPWESGLRQYGYTEMKYCAASA
jgi:hypothetical protein